MRRAGLKVAALAAVAVFAFAGCGGDDDDDDSAGGGGSGGTVSEAEFQEQADAICQKFNDQLDAKSAELEESLTSTSSTEDFTKVFIEEILPLFRDQIDELQELPTPDENAQAYEDLFNDLEDATDNVEQMAKDDPEALFSSESDPYAELDQRAQELGLDTCGNSDDTGADDTSGADDSTESDE